MEQKTVEVRARSRPSGLSQIPPSVLEELAGKGMHAFLASGHANVVAQRSVRGAWPLLAEELDPSSVKEAQRMGFRRAADGTLVRGDCILYAQSLQEREANRSEDQLRLLQQENVESVYEQIEDWNKTIRDSGGAAGEVVPKSVHSAREHVTNPQSLYERLRSGLSTKE